MSTITNVSRIPNFNEQTYANLVEQARSQGIGASQVENLLLEEVNSGKSFDLAVSQVSQNLPRLAPPNGADYARIAEFGVLPSPGTLVMSLITKGASEHRQRNQEIRHLQTEQVVESMQDEVKKLNSMAAMQLSMGIVSGTLTIAGGVAQVGFAGAALKTGGGSSKTGTSETSTSSTSTSSTSASSAPSSSKIATANSQSKNAIGSGISQAGGGLAGIFKAIGDFYATESQAEMKKMQADQEKIRESREAVKSLDDGLKELIQKLLAAQDSIQQSQSQARAKILG
jgi:hypothetical protein